MRRILILIISLFISTSSLGDQGFIPFNEKNILAIRNDSVGATSFLVKGNNGDFFLVTQLHVLNNLGKKLKLSWGYEYGKFGQSTKKNSTAFEINLSVNIIWSDDEKDIAILNAPKEIKELCLCEGLKLGTFSEGPALIVGYPITGRRIYPRTSRLLSYLGELFGKVEQMQSKGKVWSQDNISLGDIDALPGNSGSPVLNLNGEVIGIIKILKTWHGNGYQYLVPSIEITPIEDFKSRILNQNRS